MTTFADGDRVLEGAASDRDALERQDLRGLRLVEERDAVGDDLGRVALEAVPVDPAASAKAIFDLNLAAAGEELHAALGLATEYHDAMPLRSLLALAVLIRERLVRRNAQVGDGGPALAGPELRIVAEIADEMNDVDAAH